jgi:hypothetical protein
MSEGAVSAGGRLRQEMDAALKRASDEMGQPADQQLEWTEQELVALEAACSTADRAEVIREAFADELAGEKRPTVLVKLSAETRALDRQVVELVAKAARKRWGAAR